MISTETLLTRIEAHVSNARINHPHLYDMHTETMTIQLILLEEIGEVAKAINDYREKPHQIPERADARIVSECLDVVAVCVRYLANKDESVTNVYERVVGTVGEANHRDKSDATLAIQLANMVVRYCFPISTELMHIMMTAIELIQQLAEEPKA